MEQIRDNEIGFWMLSLYNGIMFGFGKFTYDDNGVPTIEYQIRIPFLTISKIRQLVTEAEADEFLNQQ